VKRDLEKVCCTSLLRGLAQYLDTPGLIRTKRVLFGFRCSPLLKSV
jgi:hypothetical protein